MSTEIAVNRDEVVQPINRDDIATNLEFLRAAGLLPPLPLPANSPVIKGNSDSSAMLGLTKAIKALAQDVSVKMMDHFGKRRGRWKRLRVDSRRRRWDQLELLLQAIPRHRHRRCKMMAIQHLLIAG
jgi:hypothetical protein